jgi:hypothetical protein
MAKTMIIWRANTSAPWPADPTESAKLNEMMWAQMDSMLKAGQVLEFGFFPDAISGYVIANGGPADQYMGSFSMYPWVVSEVHEIVPFEKGKEIGRAVLKGMAEQMAAMKR